MIINYKELIYNQLQINIYINTNPNIMSMLLLVFHLYCKLYISLCYQLLFIIQSNHIQSVLYHKIEQIIRMGEDHLKKQHFLLGRIDISTYNYIANKMFTCIHNWAQLEKSIRWFICISPQLICFHSHFKKLLLQILNKIKAQAIVLKDNLKRKFFRFLRDLQQLCDSLALFFLSQQNRSWLYQEPYLREQESYQVVFSNSLKNYLQYLHLQRQQTIKTQKARIQAKHYQKDYLSPQDLSNSSETCYALQHSKSECLFCIKQIKQRNSFFQNKQAYSFITFSQLNRDIFNEKLKQKVASLLNNNGGVIFVVQKEDDGDGFTFQFAANYDLLGQALEDVRRCIFPSHFQYTLEKINVYGKNRETFKITVIPDLKQLKNTFFVRNQNQSFYSLHFIDLLSKDKSQDILCLASRIYYSTILKKYKQVNKKNEQFEYLITYKYPIKVPSNINYHSMNILSYLPGPIQNKANEMMEKKKDIEPKMVYKNNSLLIYSSALLFQEVEIMKKKYEQNKMPTYIFNKPYQSFRSNSRKQIWFFSHEYNLQSMARVIKNAAALKPKFLAFITIMKYLKVQKVTQIDLQQFFIVFYEVFNKNPEYFWCIDNSTNLTEIYMKFSNYQESVFAFIELDNLRIKSKFVKERQYCNKMQEIINQKEKCEQDLCK